VGGFVAGVFGWTAGVVGAGAGAAGTGGVGEIGVGETSDPKQPLL